MPDSCILNGIELNAARDLTSICPRDQAEAAALDFCREWFSSTESIPLHTSGSTGKPKTIIASKAAMRESAKRSCEVFGLHRGDIAILALPLDYIAGKMMVVRALVAGLDLRVVQPASDVLARLDELVGTGCHPDFMPVVPMQIHRILQHPNANALLSRVRCLLLGGGFVDATIEQALAHVPNRAYASYGMTETLSHIALRRLNGDSPSAYYTPLRGVTPTLTREGTLKLSIPYLGIENLRTHDLAELLPDGRFRILGRRDAVINSGGVKIQAEEIEHQLRQQTGLELVLIGTPHPLLGECVTLLWEGDTAPTTGKALETACRQLAVYARPKRVLHVGEIPRTPSGKLARAACRELACQLLGLESNRDIT